MDTDRIDQWLLQLHGEADPVEASMRNRGQDADFPIIGPVVGRFYEQQLRSIGARQVLEMGSGFGYSTWWAARAVGELGHVVHTDGSAELSAEARRWLTQADLVQRVSFDVGDALERLRGDSGPWDAIFIDVDKEQYPQAWRLAADRVRMGGMVIMDNALWSGRAMDPKHRDDATRGVREAVQLAMQDHRFITSLAPLRDGVMVALRA